MEVNTAMETTHIASYKINDLLSYHKSLFELKNEFYTKYNEILLIKDDPSTDLYHRLYNELWDLHRKIRNIEG